MFRERFLRLLSLADGPIPGDRVRVRKNAKNKHWHDKIAIVRNIAIVTIEADGETHELTPQTLEVIEDQEPS